MKNDIYTNPDIITGQNIIAKVYSPIITDKEKERRMGLIKRASVDLVLSKSSPRTQVMR